MGEVSNKVRQGVEEAARIIDEYKQRLTQVIEEEGERIRKEAELESANIIARAREEAEQIRKEAERESASIIAGANG